MVSNRSNLYLKMFLRLQSRKSLGNLFPKMHSYSQNGLSFFVTFISFLRTN